MNCPLCKGEMKTGKTNLPFELKDNLLVVRDVPALVCDQCGDAFIEFEIVESVEKIVASAEKDGVIYGFIKFPSAA